MSFTPQPYPLFLARLDGDRIETARIIGWVSPDEADFSSVSVQPLAVFFEADGSITEPKYIELDDDPHWMGNTRSEARHGAKEARSAAKLRAGSTTHSDDQSGPSRIVGTA